MFSVPLEAPAAPGSWRITVAFILLTVRPLKLFDAPRVRVPAPAAESVTVRLPELLAVPSAMFTPIVLLKPLTSKTPPLVPMETARVGFPVIVLAAMKLAVVLVAACRTAPLDQLRLLVVPVTTLDA